MFGEPALEPCFGGEADGVGVAGDDLPLQTMGPGVAGAMRPGRKRRGDFVGERDLAAFAGQTANGVWNGEIDAAAAIHMRNILPKNRAIAARVDGFEEGAALMPFVERDDVVGEIGISAR